jgi:hypothetical protein
LKSGFINKIVVSCFITIIGTCGEAVNVADPELLHYILCKLNEIAKHDKKIVSKPDVIAACGSLHPIEATNIFEYFRSILKIEPYKKLIRLDSRCKTLNAKIKTLQYINTTGISIEQNLPHNQTKLRHYSRINIKF